MLNYQNYSSEIFTSNDFKIDHRLREHLTKVYSMLGLFITVFLSTLYLSQTNSKYIIFQSHFLLTIVHIALMASLSLTKNKNIKGAILIGIAYFSACLIKPAVQMIHKFDNNIFMLASLYSICLFVSLSASAFLCGKRSFLFLSPFLFYGLMGLTILSIFGSFGNSAIALYTGFFIFCGMILVETQEIIYRFEQTNNSDYIKDALKLGMNFVNIFIRILIILARNKMKKKEEKEKENK